MLDAGQQEADANAWPVTIAIADDGVHLLGLRRLYSAARSLQALPHSRHVAAACRSSSTAR
ncbi:hypothetical protein MELB17_16833 [Marinobacter sp. ELB17]|nr:hypothetical protein MELB17_16833 [Marinobacter sp. ELB17]